jgi:hypothetical protein
MKTSIKIMLTALVIINSNSIYARVPPYIGDMPILSETEQKLKSLCDKNTERVWVYKDKICVPNNPCKDNKYLRYCSSVFAEFQANSALFAAELVNIYAKNIGYACQAGNDIREIEDDTRKIGQNYIACAGIDYLVFKFLLITDSAANATEYRKREGYCLAFGGRAMDPSYITDLADIVERYDELKKLYKGHADKAVICLYISESECNDIPKFNHVGFRRTDNQPIRSKGGASKGTHKDVCLIY